MTEAAMWSYPAPDNSLHGFYLPCEEIEEPVENSNHLVRVLRLHKHRIGEMCQIHATAFPKYGSFIEVTLMAKPVAPVSQLFSSEVVRIDEIFYLLFKTRLFSQLKE